MENNTTYKPDDTDILRQISIAYYLDNQGFKPVKRHRTGKELLYLSPQLFQDPYAPDEVEADVQCPGTAEASVGWIFSSDTPSGSARKGACMAAS